MYKIIFVCEWNTCRSAMAKYIFIDLLRKSGLIDKIFVDSAGCITKVNEPIGRRTLRTLQEQNIPIDDEHISKPFTIQEYNAFDCVIALDNRTLNLARQISLDDPDHKIRLFHDFDGKNISVADPGFRGDHFRAYQEIYSGCQNLLQETILNKVFKEEF